MALTIRGIHRLGLWFMLIILTITLLAFPTHLTLEYYSIQSTRIFDNLPLFAVLFCVWLAVLLLLLFSRRREEDNGWEKLALVCIFSAVFLGFWTILTYDGGSGEGIHSAAHVKYLNEVGRIVLGHRGLGYFDFPGLHLMGSFVSQVTGLDVLIASSLIVFSQALGLAALLYALFRRLLNSAYAAPLAVLLVIQGNIWTAKLNIFHPRNLGVILLVAFLVITTRHKEGLFRTVPDTILMLIVAAATTMTHFVTSFLLFFIMLGIYVVQKLDRTNKENTPLLIIFLMFPLVWSIYTAILTFEPTIKYILKALQDWIEGKDILWIITMLQQANVGERMPLWSNISRLFWWLLIYGLGSILGLWNLLRLKKLSPMQKKTTGVLLGIIMVSGISIVGSPGGERFDTYILYGAFATVPILLWFLLRFRNRIRRYAFICLAVLLFILSFPTFLSHNNTIALSAWYPDENAYGRFLESNSAESALYLLDPETNFLVSYYTPNAYFYRVTSIMQMRDEAGLWAEIEWLVGTSFESWPNRPETPVILLLPKRSMVYYQHFITNVTPDHPRWQDLKDRLSYHDKIYDSGNIQMFAR